MEPEVNTAIQTPPPGEVAPPQPEETTSLADHAAQFDPKRTESAESVPPQEPAVAQPDRPRHRAQKDRANAEDVPRINELTQRLRQAERERDEWKTKASQQPLDRPREQRVDDVPRATDARPTGKPVWQTFEAQIGEKYQTWGEAQDAYVDARDDWKESQARSAYAQQQQTQAQQTVVEAYVKRAQDYGKAHPGFHEKMKASERILDNIPDLLFQSILRLDSGPEITEYLVDHPVELDTMCLLTEGKPVTDESVARLQRRLNQYRQPAADSASAAPAMPPRLAPRPPNALRTGPLKTGDEPLAEDHSIAEHRRAFGPKRR